jgi:cysteine-rich repeat protein
MTFCTDSDAGLNYNTVGNVIEEIDGNRTITWDQCRDAQTLAEAYCEASSVATQLYGCPQGCDAGKCRNFSSFSASSTFFFSIASSSIQYSSFPPSSSSVPACVDSDEGTDYSKRGKVVWKGGEVTDSCIDNKTVVERYCTEAGPLAIIARCDDQCVQGACVPYGFVPPTTCDIEPPLGCAVSGGATAAASFGNHCYLYYPCQTDWYTARKKCEGIGAHLVTITSASENTLVGSLNSNGWIGFTDARAEGKPEWVTGETGVGVQGYDNDNGKGDIGKVNATFHPLEAQCEQKGVIVATLNADEWTGFTDVRGYDSGSREGVINAPYLVAPCGRTGVVAEEDCWLFLETTSGEPAWDDVGCTGGEHGMRGYFCEFDSLSSLASFSITTAPFCGDGYTDRGEMCDDGNNKAGDGCSAACKVERWWYCDGSPSFCIQGQRPLDHIDPEELDGLIPVIFK